jgi:hypothetical protein
MMTEDISKITLNSEGYSADDWLPYLSKFHEADFLTQEWSEDTNLRDYVNQEGNQTGLNPRYHFPDRIAYLNFRFSPYLRSEHGIMLEGNVRVDPGLRLDDKKEYGVYHGFTRMFFEDTNPRYVSVPDIPDRSPKLADVIIEEGINHHHLDNCVDILDSFVSELGEEFQPVVEEHSKSIAERYSTK